MQVFGTKLSKHVLGMKFMRKTKEQLDQDNTETSHRKHFGVPASSTKNTKSVAAVSTSTSKKSDKHGLKSNKTAAGVTLSNKLPTIVEETPSYSQCLGHTFGRFSFGGFNPVVEYNMKRGTWKAGYSLAIAELSDEDNDHKNEEKDVDDTEMAEALRGGSLIGTLGKHFMNKKERSEQQQDVYVPTKGNPILNEAPVRSNRHKTNKQPGWKKDGSSWFNANGQQALRKSDYKDSPPQKKRKFMKPSDG